MRPCHLPLQSVIARPPDPSTVHRLAPHRGMLHSRQASNNSNQQSSLDDSGVVDDHDGDDVTSAEEHEKRESREHRAERCSPREHGTLRVQTVQPRPADYPPAPVTISVKTGNREIRVLKCNGVKTKKHMYALPPEYLSHIVVLGEPFSIVPALLSTTVSRDGHPRDSPPPAPRGSSRIFETAIRDRRFSGRPTWSFRRTVSMQQFSCKYMRGCTRAHPNNETSEPRCSLKRKCSATFRVLPQLPRLGAFLSSSWRGKDGGGGISYSTGA